MIPLDFGPRDIDRLHRAFEDAPEGARIRLSAGDYRITKPLGIRSSLSIQGKPGKTHLRGQGSGILFSDSKNVKLRLSGLTFEGAEGKHSPVLRLQTGTTLDVDNCRFTRNKATQDAGVMNLHGVATATFTRSIFEGNRSEEGGGALEIGGGGEVVCDRCLFIGNRSQVGGALYLRPFGAIKLVHCTFVDNVATWPMGGGALFVMAGTDLPANGFIVNCVFRGQNTVNADPSKKYEIYFRNSILPPECLVQPRLHDVANNTVVSPQLVALPNGLYAVAPGSPGAGTADLKFTPANALDVLDHPLVCDGIADPGALGRSR